jgi:sigma-B regulation protein RsbU (phosphoserine phosphatase)
MELSVESKLEMKELQLTSLFETIQAINSNATQDNLYKIFMLTLRANKNIVKMAMYVKDENDWNCKAYYGTKHNYNRIPLDEKIIEITSITTQIRGINYFDEFEKIIPVKHKSDVLAYVLLSAATQEENDEILDLDFLEALSHIIIVAIENKKLAKKEQEQASYKKQLEIAKDVQSLLFPKHLPYNDKLKITANYLPHHSVGGDYYDFIEIEKDKKFMICIADVSGKGIPAALLMANFQGALKSLTRREYDLKKIAKELNTLILQNANGENFITAFFMIYDFRIKKLSYINAGHNPPMLFMNGQVRKLEEGTTILGGMKDLPMLDLGEVYNADDFLVFCFTDGFTETYNEDNQEFGEEHLERFLVENQTEDLKKLHIKLMAEMKTFKGANEHADDITLISCRVKA